jgi:transposase
VERIFTDGIKEVYRVSGNNKSIVVESNRPLLRSKGLKYKKPKWKMSEGQLHNMSFLEKIYAAIMKEVDK